MSINTLPYKMVALKVIQWDLHWQDSPRLVQVFYYAIFLTAMQFNVSVLPCISQFLAPSICCWVSGGGVTCRPQGRGRGRYNQWFKLHKSIVCTKPPSTELYITFDMYITAMGETKVVDLTFLPSHYFSQLILNGAFIWFLKRPKIEFGKLWRSFLFLLVHI